MCHLLSLAPLHAHADGFFLDVGFFALCSHLRRQSSYYRLSSIMPCAACASLKSCRLFCPVLHFSVLVNSKGHWNLSAVAGVILFVSGHHDFVRISNSSLTSNNVRAGMRVNAEIGSIGNELPPVLCVLGSARHSSALFSHGGKLALTGDGIRSPTGCYWRVHC